MEQLRRDDLQLMMLHRLMLEDRALGGENARAQGSQPPRLLHDRIFDNQEGVHVAEARGPATRLASEEDQLYHSLYVERRPQPVREALSLAVGLPAPRPEQRPVIVFPGGQVPVRVRNQRRRKAPGAAASSHAGMRAAEVARQ